MLNIIHYSALPKPDGPVEVWLDTSKGVVPFAHVRVSCVEKVDVVVGWEICQSSGWPQRFDYRLFTNPTPLK